MQMMIGGAEPVYMRRGVRFIDVSGWPWNWRQGKSNPEYTLGLNNGWS